MQIFDVLKNERRFFSPPFATIFHTHIFSINGKLKNCRIFNLNEKWRIKSNDSTVYVNMYKHNLTKKCFHCGYKCCLPSASISLKRFVGEGIIVLDAHRYIPFKDGSSPGAKWTTITILGMNWMVKIEWLYNGYDSRLNLFPAIVVFVVVAGMVRRAMERFVHKKFHYR